MLAADNWCVKVDDRVYGPYSSQQLRKFAHEGRLAAWSQVSPAGSRTWRAAREEPAISSFFGADPARSDNKTLRAFGKRDDAAPTQDEPKAKPAARKTANPKREIAASEETGLANFIIIFDVVSATASRVEMAVLNLGAGFRIADNVWTVCCELTAIGVRNAIAPYLLPRESILVVDAKRGRTSWQNYSPETHAKLAAAWAGSKQ